MSAVRFQFALLASIGTLAIAGQLSVISQKKAPAPKDGKVRVFVYRNSGILEMEFKPSVFADETDVAQVQAGHNLTLALAPGTHTFRSTDKKAGQQYFVRIDVSLAALKGHGKVVSVAPEQAAPEYAQTKPADDSMLKDRSLIAPEFLTK
jgi:hypothetical protein